MNAAAGASNVGVTNNKPAKGKNNNKQPVDLEVMFEIFVFHAMPET